MNSRQRLLAAMNYKEPDRVPVDLGASPVTGIAASTYMDLKKALGIDTPTHIAHGLQLAFVEEEVQRRLGADVRRVGPVPTRWKPWTFADGTAGLIDEEAEIDLHPDGSQVLHATVGVDLHMPPGGWFFDPVDESQPLRTATSTAQVTELFRTLPAHPSAEQQDLIVSRARQLARDNQYGIYGDLATAVFECWLYRGFENFLTDFLADPDMAVAQMREHAEYYLEYWRPVFDRIGNDLDVLFVSDDLGSQQSLLVSEDVYVEYVKPLHKWMWGELKKAVPSAKLFLHSCGAVEPLIPHFIELGVDILNPIQLSAKGMVPAELKKKYGRDIVFWGGGVDTQISLLRGTPAQVKAEVRRNIEDLAPGGGFVFTAVHDIQPATPVENIIAMFEAAEEYGKY